jgi:hypothetical protein
MTPIVSPSHIHKGWGFHLGEPRATGHSASQWCPQQGERRHKGAVTIATNKELVEAFTQFNTNAVAQLGQARSPPQLISATPTGRALTQLEAPPRYHQQAPASSQPHHQSDAGPVSHTGGEEQHHLATHPSPACTHLRLHHFQAAMAGNRRSRWLPAATTVVATAPTTAASPAHHRRCR